MQKMIAMEHKLDCILIKRIKCMWMVEETGKRCINGTYSCCRACTKNGKPFLLCGIHMRAHQELELNVFMQQINRN